MKDKPLEPKVICLVGGDGTGKTAHAKKLVSDLKSRGRECSYVWFGQPYLLSYPFMFLCNKLGYTKNHRLPNHIVTQEHQYYRNRVLAFVWPWIQALDLAIMVLLQVRLPASKGKTVVCDRFVYDTLVELMTDIADSSLYRRAPGKLILSLRPTYAAVVRLNVDAKTAFERKNDVPDVRFLKNRRDNYEIISSRLDLSTVDAEEPFDVVHKKVKQISGIK